MGLKAQQKQNVKKITLEVVLLEMAKTTTAGQHLRLNDNISFELISDLKFLKIPKNDIMKRLYRKRLKNDLKLSFFNDLE